MARASRRAGLISHSQTTRGYQPISLSSADTLMSRSTLAASFLLQNSVLVCGSLAFRQSACRCQKQPFTNTTLRFEANTKSGLPGSFLSLTRYRSPCECKNRRTMSSGLVSLPRTLAITWLRFSGAKTSVIQSFSFPSGPQYVRYGLK